MNTEETPKNNEEELKENEKPEKTDELSKCQKERDEYLDGWKRAKADLINYKKDETKRFESVIKFSNEGLILNLVNVLDSFDLALAALGQPQTNADKTQKGADRGLYLIRQQLEDILKQNGLERIIISIGEPFDPSLQEAVAEIESDQKSGTIIEEVERGYLLNGKLIRPARVKVAK